MKKKIEPPSAVSKKETFPIVAIGASAGGIEAIKELLLHLNPDLGFGYVYIQHLDPDHKSILSSILGKCTKMKVVQAEQLMHIERNRLYIIPPNKDMSVIDHVVILNPRKERPAMHMPVDRFFISLAEKHKNGAIGIVLSGNAHDGTAGLKAIKMAGGITIAQDDSATFNGMPSSAIAEGVADFVLSPSEIADELEIISKRTHLFSKIRAAEANVSDAEEGLADIIQLLRKTVGVDFTHYKMSTIKRRILRRMVLHKAETLSEYYQLLKKNNAETVLLYQDLLINVTFFFRDADSIEFLKKTILPGILAGKLSNEPVRIWVPACSTGEEAYSLAITLMELLGDNEEETDVQIFATDLSETAIAKARVGIYTVLELEEVSEAYLKKYFIKTENGYRINKQIRDICIFAHHNVFKDPPFSRLDLISCCNLFIYLNADLQKKIIATFYYALSPNGYLVLGKSETIGLSGQLFSQVQKKFKVYSKKPDSSGKAILEMGYRLPFTERTQVMEPKKVIPKISTDSTSIEKTVDGILQAKYIPGSVVINQEMEILQFRGATSLYLEPSPGKASFNLMKMARPGLVFELRNTIHKATRTGEPVKKEGIDILIKNHSYKVSVEVMPLKSENEDRLFLIIFEEEQPAPKGPKTVFSKDETALKLQEELNNVREDMRSIIEEQEVGKEELQSANEEIISSNEELQSINEELETSNEEVESANEELMTINTQLQLRNEELSESQEYAEAIFDTIGEAVIVLDKNFSVQMANSAFYKIFGVKEDDVLGSLFYDLSNKQWNSPALKDLLYQVMQHGTQFDGFEIEHKFPILGVKTLLLNAKKIVQKQQRRELILIAIQDITQHKAAEKIIAERELLFKNMADNAPVLIWTAGTDKKRNFFNITWLNFTGKTAQEVLGDGWMDNIHAEDRVAYLQVYNNAFDNQIPFKIEYRLKRHDGKYCRVLSNAKPTFGADGKFTGFIGACTDLGEVGSM